jgi:hypothetical protein
LAPLVGILVLALALGLAQGPSARAEAGQGAASALPWKVGDTVQGVGTLERLSRHPEYVRMVWRDGDTTLGMEIVPALGPEDPWTAGPYRVQPAPGARAHPEALGALRAELARRASEPGHRPFVSQARAPTGPEDALSTPTSRGEAPYPPRGAPWLLLLAVLGVGGALGALSGHLGRSTPPGEVRDPREGRVAAMGAVAAALGGLAVLVTLDPGTIDPLWISILHEGNTEHVIRSLWGAGHHGPLQDALRWAADGLTGSGDLLPIRVIVLVNLSLAVANSVALVIAGRLILGGWLPALAIGAAVAMSPLFVNAATSELPAQLLFTLCLAMFAALVGLERARWLSLGALVCLVLALGLTRAEWGLAGGLVLTAAVAAPWLENRWHRGGWKVSLAVMAVAAAVFLGAPSLLEGERATYLGVGLTPFDGAILGLPVVVVVGAGAGLVALAGLGFVALLRRPVWLGVPLALVLLARMYGEASHRAEAPYEALRYAQFLLPLVAILALVGWREVAMESPGLALAPRVRMPVMAGLAVLLFLPVGEPLARAVFPDHHLGLGPEALYDAPLERDQQLEARALLRLAEEPSPCVAVAVSARDPKPTDPIAGWDYVFFGGPVAAPLTVERDVARLSAHAADLGSGRCVRFISGLDCHVEGYPGCERERAMGQPDHALDASFRPYYDHLKRAHEAKVQVIRWGHIP